MWSVLSSLYPTNRNPCRVFNYVRYQDTLNLDGIDFPVQTKEIPKFEKQNPTISVNVIFPDDNDKGFCVECLSPEQHRQHHVNLLLICDSETSHYVHIRNFSRLVSDLTKHNGKSFVCNSCLNAFSEKDEYLASAFPDALRIIRSRFTTRTQLNRTSVTDVQGT